MLPIALCVSSSAQSSFTVGFCRTWNNIREGNITCTIWVASVCLQRLNSCFVFASVFACRNWISFFIFCIHLLLSVFLQRLDSGLVVLDAFVCICFACKDWILVPKCGSSLATPPLQSFPCRRFPNVEGEFSMLATEQWWFWVP